MSITVNFKKNKTKKNSSQLAIFVDENFNLLGLTKYISKNEYSLINDLLKSRDKKKKILVFEVSSKRKIILISIRKDIKNSEIENLGAKFYDFIKTNKKNNQYIINTDHLPYKKTNIAECFLHGLKLKSYNFNKYITKKDNINFKIIVIGKNITSLMNIYQSA